MPLKLIAPRAPSPHWRVRGTYLGVYIDRGTKTSDRTLAQRQLVRWRSDIESGAFTAQIAAPTFASAALSYMQAGGERQFLPSILRRIGTLSLSAITQAIIDDAAIALYPNAAPASRNRACYTPISAVLRHAGVQLQLRRPKGSAGQRRTAYLQPEQAFALIDAAVVVDSRLGALTLFLLYTGARLSEALRLERGDINLANGTARLVQSKTGTERIAVLPQPVIIAIANLPERKRVFGLSKCGRLYMMLNAAAVQANVTIPDRVAFHIFRHTWATWMRDYGGLDTSALVATGAWADAKSARIYEHINPSTQSAAALRLPVKRVKSV